MLFVHQLMLFVHLFSFYSLLSICSLPPSHPLSSHAFIFPCFRWTTLSRQDSRNVERRTDGFLRSARRQEGSLRRHQAAHLLSKAHSVPAHSRQNLQEGDTALLIQNKLRRIRKPGISSFTDRTLIRAEEGPKVLASPPAA